MAISTKIHPDQKCRYLTDKEAERNNREAKSHLKEYKRLKQEVRKFFEKHQNENGYITDPLLMKEVMALEKLADDANTATLRACFRGRVVWQGLV